MEDLLICDIIILLLISTIFIINCENSTVTLRVSQSGQQKIFNSGTNPNQVFLDDNIQQKVNNSY